MSTTARTGPARRIERLKHSDDPDTRIAGYALERYLLDPRAEGAFYIRFCAMAPMQRQALERFWRITEEWRLFRRLCRFFRI